MTQRELTLVLEILSEEIPASMQEEYSYILMDHCMKKIRTFLHNDSNITGKNFSTPRRIGCFIYNIPENAEETIEEIRGPRVNASEGALNGFLKKYSVEKKDLTIDGDFFFLRKKIASQPFANILQKIIEETMINFTWPKSMRWGNYDIRWIRPIHSILCLLGTNEVRAQFGHITAGRKTSGHRFLAPDDIYLDSADEYESLLRQAKVEIFPSQRKKMIEDSIKLLAAKHNIQYIKDPSLLDEVAGLVELPYVAISTIDEKFLALPKEVLVATLKNNQKYFLYENNDQSIAPFFTIVSNVEINSKTENIVHNNRKVMQARLYDALFFYNKDKKIALESRVDDLKTLLFHEKIGSVYDKMESTRTLAVKIAEQLWHTKTTRVSNTVDLMTQEFLHVDPKIVFRAVTLMKTDLLTDMVTEFPELQGIMGYYYALYAGEPNDVAEAIRDQYKPKGLDDVAPTSLVSCVVAIAEKLDTLVQMFKIGIKPTGSKDPFALRRAAIGILRIQEKNGFRLNLQALNIDQDVIHFIDHRMKYMDCRDI